MKLEENTTTNDYVAISIPITDKTVDALDVFLDEYGDKFCNNGVAAFVLKVGQLRDALSKVNLDEDDYKLYEVDDKLLPIENEEIFDKLAYIYDADEVEDDGIDKKPEIRKYSTEEINNMAGPMPEPGVPENLKKYFDESKDTSKMFEQVFNENYYDDPVNHPEGGGTCDICEKEVQPGDGYEPDFDSCREIAEDALYEKISGGKSKYKPEYYYHMADDLGLDEDEYDDAVQDIIRDAFGEASYICPDCAHEKIREAAFKWIDDNYELN